MPVRAVDDKASDTLVVGPWRMVLDGEFDSPPSPPCLSGRYPPKNGIESVRKNVPDAPVEDVTGE